MTVKTVNIYGNIAISNQAIALVAGYSALDCYGVVDLVSQNLAYKLCSFFTKKPLTRGIKVTIIDNRIYLRLNVILKYGVSISAVADSLKKTVRYSVEKFTGMIVDAVNINVMGIKV